MGRFKRTLGPTVPIAGALALWVVAVATVPVETTPAVAAVTSGAPAPAQVTGYVGEDTCLGCHEDQTKGYHGSPHGNAANAKTPAATHGCESCHGPGQAHVDAGGDRTQIKTFTALTPSEASEICATCHNRGSHMMWDSSAHENRGVACSTCHSIHDPKSPKAALKTATISETCAECHRDKVMKTRRSAHMPVANDPQRPGNMECTSCHNPHGSTNVKMLKAGTSVSDSCTSCHPEKRGPYLWEHATVVDSCTNCHDPHGSSFDRMLVTKQPMLCQRCHVTTRHPPTVYNNYLRKNATSANRIVGRSCVVCHQNIHGSNAASGKFFLR